MLPLLLASLAHAVPVEMNHQGRLTDASGAGLAGSQVITFRIYDADSGGSVLWSSAVAIEFDDGYYSVQLGEDGSLDADALSQYPVWMELELSGSGPMEPRYALASVPYSVISERAESLFGGPVDATELFVNGIQVVDEDGNWVGTGSTGTGSAAAVLWGDIQGVPADLADGDDDTFLSESDVESYIQNGTVNLATGSTMGGFDLLNTGSILAPYWSNLQGVPSDLADGDGDTLGALGCAAGQFAGWDGSVWACTDFAAASQLSESDVENYVENGPLSLASGSTVGGDAILTADDLEDPEWGDLQDIPADLDDGDDDTLSELSCQDGETVEWDGSDWICVSVSFSDTDSLGALSCADGQIPVRSGGVWVCGDDLDTDTDSLSVLGCADGQVAAYSADDAGWVCSDVSDSDSLAVLGCTGGQVPAYSEEEGGWICSDVSDADSLAALACTDGQAALYSSDDTGWICGDAAVSGELAVENTIGSSDGGEFYDSLDTPAVIPDSNATGFVSARSVGGATTISTLSLDLEVDHGDMGELTVILTSPSLTAVTVYDGGHPGQDGFDGNLGWDYEMFDGDLYSFFGESAFGLWTLQVIDNAGDTGGGTVAGNIESWTIRLNEDWDGEIFVGDNVTVQETLVVRGELRIEYGGALVMTNTDGDETVRVEAEDGSGLVPAGGIMMWSGSTGDIPPGWALCDGNSGTPDLRDRFVVPAGNSYSPGDFGDSSASVSAPTGNSGSTSSAYYGSHYYVASVSVSNIVPKYYALAFIMKL